MNKTLGSIISDIRKKNKLSQLDIANKLNCSREFISQVENNRRYLPETFIIPLSVALNYDFTTLINNLDKFKTYEHFLITHELIDYIEQRNIEKIDWLLKHNTLIDELNYGYSKTITTYCKAVILAKNNNFHDSNKLCFDILEINSLDDINLFKPHLHRDDRYYSTILALGKNLYCLEEFNLEKILLENTIDFLKHYYFNGILPNSTISIFFKRFYICILNNYADVLFILNDYDNALINCQEAIDIAVKNNILYLLHMLLELKVEILYKKSNLINAKNTYLHFNSLCHITKNEKYFLTTTKRFEKSYPDLFK